MSDSNIYEIPVTIGRRLYEKGLVTATDGNLSCRLDDGTIVVTASGTALGRLDTNDFVVLSPDGDIVSGTRKPSSEYLMHLAVYRHRPDINAVCHAHPPYATASAVTGNGLPSGILPEIVLFVGDIPLTAYAPPGTDAVPKALLPFLADHQAFLLRNHGVLTIGADIEQAYNRMEAVEHYARIVYIANRSGGPTALDPAEIRRLEEIGKSLQSG